MSRTVPSEVLHRLTTAIFVATGAPEPSAVEVADVLVDNHLAGHDSHGVLRIPQYLQAIDDGLLDPAARPEVLEETAVTALVSGNWSFGQVAANTAADLATEKALAERIACVSVVKANHTGRLAAFTERGARRGVAMFMAVGTVERPRTAPFGGAAAALGTNPVAFSIPNGDGPPVSLDYATSAIANGKIKVAEAEGKPLPEGVVLDKDGRPTTDPRDYFEGGFLLPFGGHKGYALAVIADLLGTALTGADAFPAAVPRSGLFIFAVAADAFRDRAAYEQGVAAVLERITSVPPAHGFDEVLLPGAPEARARAEREEHGIPVADTTWDAVTEAARGLGVDLDAVLA